MKYASVCLTDNFPFINLKFNSSNLEPPLQNINMCLNHTSCFAYSFYIIIHIPSVLNTKSH